MKDPEIPADVLRFIERRIDSVPHLEALLLLREHPNATWSESAIAARVYVSRETAGVVLRDLAQKGLIGMSREAPDLYSYNPQWDEYGLMDKVAASYRRHLVDLSRIIHAKASSEAVRDFARAFQFKGEE